MRRLLALIFTLSACLTSALAQDAPYRVHLQLPEGGPKQLGQRFELVVDLAVQKPYELDRSSVPAGGRIGLHLRQFPVRVQRGWHWSSRHYRLVIAFQVIGHSDARASVLVPPLVLALRAGEREYPLVLEPFSVEIAPGPPLTGRSLGQPLALSPPLQVPPSQGARWWFTLTLGCAGMFAVLAWAVWEHLLGPYWRRRQRPFVRALRAFDRLPAKSSPERALQLLHGAFDASAGATVLSSDLPDFLCRQAHYAKLEQQLRAFFDRSDSCLYGREVPPLSNAEMRAVLLSCAAIEARQ